MLLRSGFMYNEFNHDFDYSSKMWRKNKIYIGYGKFRYKIMSKLYRD